MVPLTFDYAFGSARVKIGVGLHALLGTLRIYDGDDDGDGEDDT